MHLHCVDSSSAGLLAGLLGHPQLQGLETHLHAHRQCCGSPGSVGPTLS